MHDEKFSLEIFPGNLDPSPAEKYTSRGSSLIYIQLVAFFSNKKIRFFTCFFWAFFTFFLFLTFFLCVCFPCFPAVHVASPPIRCCGGGYPRPAPSRSAPGRWTGWRAAAACASGTSWGGSACGTSGRGSGSCRCRSSAPVWIAVPFVGQQEVPWPWSPTACPIIFYIIFSVDEGCWVSYGSPVGAVLGSPGWFLLCVRRCERFPLDVEPCSINFNTALSV